MALAPAGIDVRSSLGGRLVFEVFRTDADDALIVDGAAVYSLQELQNDGTLKSYDFNDNTFKTGALVTPTASLTHRTSNNSTTNTGVWTAALTTISGFTVGGVYYETFTLTPATGPSTGGIKLVRKWQFGGSVGDEVAQTGDSYARIGANGASLTSLATASSITTLQSDTDDIQTRLPSALTANGNMKSSLVEILTTALTETAGLLAGGFKKFFNVATPTGTVNSLPAPVPGAAGGLPLGDASGRVDLGNWLGSAPDALSSGKVPADLKLWLTAAPAALSTNGYVQAMLLRWLTDNAGGTPDALSSGKLPADLKLWLATAPLALSSQQVQAIVSAYASGQAPLQPTVAGRTLDVSVGGEAGVDWANVGSPTTTLGLSGTTVKTATDVETDTQDLQSRLPAALVSGRMDSNMQAAANNVITSSVIAADAIGAAQIATDAIDADALKADAVAEIQSGLAGSTALATLQTEITEMHGLLGLYSGVRDSVYSGANLTSYNIFIYDSSAHALTNDGSTGVLHEYSVVNTYSGANLATSIMTKVS